MFTDEKGQAFKWAGIAFISGLALGVAGTLLLAPRSGRDTRRMLADYAKEAEGRLTETVESLKEAVDTRLEQGKQYFAETKAAVSAAIEAGKEAYKKEVA
ncbi:YtxH domain-containing protein [Candidatus Nitrospira bockiana]